MSDDMRQHCNRCGGFVTPQPETRDLFLTRGGLPIPPAADPFAAFHAESRKREERAMRRGVCRQVGAERQQRREFTLAALRGSNPKGN